MLLNEGINENGATGVLFVHETITKEHYWQVEQVVDHEAILMSSLARELVKQKCKYMQLHLQISWRTRCTIYVELGTIFKPRKQYFFIFRIFRFFLFFKLTNFAFTNFRYNVIYILIN